MINWKFTRNMREKRDTSSNNADSDLEPQDFSPDVSEYIDKKSDKRFRRKKEVNLKRLKSDEENEKEREPLERQPIMKLMIYRP